MPGTADFLKKARLPFLDRRKTETLSRAYLFNYRRLWALAVMILLAVALLPLTTITVVNYRMTEQAIESESHLRTANLVANTHRTISYFLAQRRAALDFIIHDNHRQDLQDPGRLAALLDNLNQSFGDGFVDIGIIGGDGQQRAYVGPYALENVDYRNEPWFRHVQTQGMYISDVFLGFRQVPHLVIAIKQDCPDGGCYVLRVSLGIGPFADLLAGLELSGHGDAFIVNAEGVLQSPSRYHGNVLEPIGLPVPRPSDHTEVIAHTTETGESLLVGYRFIENTPFILMIVKKKEDLLSHWYETRVKLVFFLAASVTAILVVILGMVSFIVGRVHLADEKRLATLHHMEYANKMATIGRMAASVAHEINNPLAIIGEKAGLIKDLFTFKAAYSEDPKLVGLIDSIIAAVTRAGRITKRLLTFARNLEAKIEKVNLPETIQEVLSFVERDAQHRNIDIDTRIKPGLDAICLDRGKLQQVILNIVNNAFAAMDQGGKLEIEAALAATGRFRLSICDTGRGIAAEDLSRIFEPFYSTKKSQGGTGLGLSITYGLVQEMGGKIQVESQPGEGTCFILDLPLNSKNTCPEASPCASC
ncbi:MAG: sensor histidine kinase [Desulfobacteraceae bacterium]|jgi:signal transduction histidine kinase|nr:sensor histidine kinase [Desulfobacteraceae bacterium]